MSTVELIMRYMDNEISVSDFCDQFYKLFDLGADHTFYSVLDENFFNEIGEIASRLSEFEEDHIKYPGVYYTEKDLINKISLWLEQTRTRDI